MPQLVFVVAQMRTRCRLAVEGGGGGGKGFGGGGGKGFGGKGGGAGEANVPVGTIVDETITSGPWDDRAETGDWYMVPHHGLQARTGLPSSRGSRD